MANNEKYLDEMRELIEEIVIKNDVKPAYDVEKDQPKHFSWFHIWWSIDGVMSDYGTGIQYLDAEEFQQNLVEKVSQIFNTTTLQYICDGKIKNFGMQIGPHSPAHYDVNEELGIEVSYEQ